MKDIGVERIELCSAIGYDEFANLADAKETKKMIERSRAEVRERTFQHEGAARDPARRASPGRKRSA